MDDYRAAADAIKSQSFGPIDVTFHEPEMRWHKGRYAFGGSTETQAAFDRVIDDLIERTPFTAFGTGIRKDRFFADFADTGIDSYLPTDVYAVANVMVLERYFGLSGLPIDRAAGSRDVREPGVSTGCVSPDGLRADTHGWIAMGHRVEFQELA